MFAGVLVAVVAVGVVVAVRAAGDTPAAAGPDLRLRATAEQWRVHEVNRQLGVALHNDGDRPVRVSRVELDLPSFTGAAGVDTDALLPVGGLRVDVPVSYGTGRCPAGPDPVSAPSAVVVDAAPEGGPAERVRLPLPHPNALLDKLLRYDCQQELLGRAATLTFGPWRPAPDGSLLGTLVLARGTQDVPVTLLDVTGNIKFRLVTVPATRPRPLGTLAAGAARLEIPVHALPDRCDPHAVAEIKKPYEFPATASLGGEKLPTTVAVTDTDRTALDRMAGRLCRPPS